MYGESGVCGAIANQLLTAERDRDRNFNTSLSNAAHEVYRIIYNYTDRLDNVGTIAKTISYFACKSLF